jgi:RNaseH domain of pPIWI_RE/pPIWI_RE module N-terminal domain/MID domain of pPIWI_RE
MLTTIAYRLTPELLGNVVAYPLTSDFTQAWERLPARRQPSGDRASPRYASLATALRAVAAQPAVLFPRSQLGRCDIDAGTAALLVTTSPIDRWLFTTCVRTWEQVVREDHDADTLGPVLNLDPGAPRPLAEYLERDRAGRIQGPGWLFEAARWNAARLLAQQPVKVPGFGPLRLWLDTDGDLVCWDDPISTAWRQRSWHAMVYVSTRVITLPGIPDLILRLDAHITRITDRWYGVRTVRIARSDPRSPLLKLRVRPPWPARGQPHPLIEDAAAEIVQACGLEPIELPTQLPAQPGMVRPVSHAQRHGIGKGTGARFLKLLEAHTTSQLGTSPLLYDSTKIKVGRPIEGRIEPEHMDKAIHASQTERLRLVCLYATRLTREHLTSEFNKYAAEERRPILLDQDDAEYTLTPALTVVFHRVPELAMFSTDRLIELVTEGTWREHDDHTRIAACVETSWDPENPSPIEDDAKDPVRRALGDIGVVSQFLNGARLKPIASTTDDGEAAGDHAVAGAVRDLFRVAGVFDHRLATATATPRTAPLDQSATLVGIHVRRHTPRRRRHGARPARRLVVQLVALHTVGDATTPWQSEMYSDQHGKWLPYADALAAYHAGDIGSTEQGRDAERAALVRDYIEEALAQLVRNGPVIVFTDTEACRSIWPGLANKHLGEGALPGDSLVRAGQASVAVIRCNNNMEVPQVVDRTEGQQPGDPDQPAMPGVRLYQLNGAGHPSWLLAQASRVHRSGQIGARAGTQHTRWTLPADEARLMSKDWHAITAIEITVDRTGGLEPLMLAALSARLCHQAPSWDDRINLPAPLHLAVRADDDHPDRNHDEEFSGENGQATS